MTKSDYTRLNIPDTPGVYRFADTAGHILYIGRATSLRDRTRSYFSPDLIVDRGPSLVDMVTKSVTLEWTQTDSVLEAVILEANLIKKYQPYYNTKERDNRSYYYVVITAEELPRVFLERGRVLQNTFGEHFEQTAKSKKIHTNIPIDVVFGPFPQGPVIREALRLLRRMFPFIEGLTRDVHRDRFYRQLRLLPDVSNAESVAKYQKTIHYLKQIFMGRKKKLVAELEAEMKSAAKNEAFEHALKLRNTISSLQHIRDITLIKAHTKSQNIKGFRIEGYDIAHISGTSMVGVMVVLENGEPQKSQYRTFRIRGFNTANDVGALREVLERRLQHAEWQIPNLIVVDGGVQQLRVGGVVASNSGNGNIPVVSVVKDNHHRPKEILGSDTELITAWREGILRANAESHRFALLTHDALRRKKMINKPTKK